MTTPHEPDSALREELAKEIYVADCNGDDSCSDWSDVDQDGREDYFRMADAALAVFADRLGQQQAAVGRVKAFADELDTIADRGLVGRSPDLTRATTANAFSSVAARLRAVLGADL